MHDPPLEGLRFGLATAQDQRVQARLADDVRGTLLGVTLITNEGGRALVVVEVRDGLARVPDVPRGTLRMILLGAGYWRL